MWALAIAVFGSFKVWTWLRAGARPSAPAWMSAGYLLFWPGMFLHVTGGLILAGIFLIQRKRLMVEGEPDISPAAVPLEPA